MYRTKGRFQRIGAGLLITAMVVGGLLLVPATPASAHCDSAQGPVVAAAQRALETGEIKYALAYVQVEAEIEMKAAFDHAMSVRKLGGEAQALADRYFAETTVRLHRIGEGAGYTGIQENPELTPGLEAAEEALESGELKVAQAYLDEAVKHGLKGRWNKVEESRAEAKKNPTVAALRAQAESELLFELFVFGVEEAAHGVGGGGSQGNRGGGHDHGGPAPAGGHDARAERPLVIRLNGVALAAPGVTVAGKALVPLRGLVEALNGQITWDAGTHTVTARVGARQLVAQEGSEKAHLDGKTIDLSTVPVNHEGSFMIPGEVLAQLAGLLFSWHEASDLVEYVVP